MIFADALPRIKTFLRPARLSNATTAPLVRLVAAFLCHCGRLSASQAAATIRSQARHRAQRTRFLARCHWSKDWAVLAAVADLLFLRTLAPPPPRRRVSKTESVRRGEAVFRARGCARCHAPPTYTISKIYEVGLEDKMGKKVFNPPSLRGVGHGVAFFHDGRAGRLEEVLTRHRHQVPANMPQQEMDDLLAFLRGL